MGMITASKRSFLPLHPLAMSESFAISGRPHSTPMMQTLQTLSALYVFDLGSTVPKNLSSESQSVWTIFIFAQIQQRSSSQQVSLEDGSRRVPRRFSVKTLNRPFRHTSFISPTIVKSV